MSQGMKSYLIGLANAGISGAAVGGTGTVLGIGWKKDAIMIAVSAVVSMVKWMVQHPIPGGAQ